MNRKIDLSKYIGSRADKFLDEHENVILYITILLTVAVWWLAIMTHELNKIQQ
jgi:hypothetical protein